jgi:hypothetical protein
VIRRKKDIRMTREIYNDYVRSEVVTAVAMQNAVFLDIKIQFVPYRKPITSLLQSPMAGYFKHGAEHSNSMKFLLFWEHKRKHLHEYTGTHPGRHQ